ncbi:alpha/beta fold hydrolase [Rhodococcoides navarretei]|uniref:Alpha/beta fold hydrolase n=1 Tax=Rhodococcus navarretei TaxID=3128981 RepID=A0ABU9D4Q3_9NOCA
MPLPCGQPRQQYREWTVDVDGAQLAVFEQGNPDGPVVILVHGWPDTHHLWDGVVPSLLESFRVITYDTRGHGQSTSRGTVAEMRIEQLADDFLVVVDSVRADRPVHVLAHDWGSVQVWDAVCRPGADRTIASFTSISGPSLHHMGRWMNSRLAARTPTALWQWFTQVISGMYTLFFMSGILSRTFFRVFGRRYLWSLFLRIVERIDREDIHLSETFTDDMVSGLRIYRANIFRTVLFPHDRFTSVPIQLLIPTRDPAVRPASFSDIDRWTADVDIHRVKSGHWLPFKYPALVASAATAFIDKHSAKE